MADESEKKIEEKESHEISLSPEIKPLLDEWTSNPKSTVFVKLADEYRKSGLFDEALEVCEEGLKDNPGYLSADMVLAKIYFDMGEYEKSMQEVTKVVTAQSDNLMAQNLLLKLYINNGDKENAIKACDIISFLDPKNEEIIATKQELEEQGIAQPEPIPVEVADDVTDDDLPEEPDETLQESVEASAEVVEEVADENLDAADDFVTNTMADLYIQQGFHKKALNIYKELLTENPGNKAILTKIEEIKKMIPGYEEPPQEISSEMAPEVEPDLVTEVVAISREVQLERLSDWLENIKNRGTR